MTSTKQKLTEKIYLLEEKLKNLGIKKREASSGGTHDNATWDTVMMEERILVAQIRDLREQLRETNL